MKSLMILKIIMLVIFLSPRYVSAEVPSNSLQVEYKQQNDQIIQDKSLINFDSVYQIPKNTYHYLDKVFTSFYSKIMFTNSITDSVFESNAHYELVSIPLISESPKGVQIELFGNFSDPVTQRLSNITEDQALSNYYSNTQVLDIYNSQLSVGAGISFFTVDGDKIKIIISNNEIPGYGSSTTLLGFERSF